MEGRLVVGLPGCWLPTLEVGEQDPPLLPARCRHCAPKMGKQLLFFIDYEASLPVALQPVDPQASLQNRRHGLEQDQTLDGCTGGHSPQGDLKKFNVLKFLLTMW